MYVFERNSRVLIGTITSKALQTTNTYSTTNLTGSEAYVWTLESATGGFYVRNVSKGNATPYLGNKSGDTEMQFTASKNIIWTFTFDEDDNVVIQNASNSNRFLGETTANSNQYKAYAASNLSNNTYPHDNMKVYLLEVTAPIISSQPSSATYITDASAIALSVTASASTGTLSYQWYSNTIESTTGATAINDATTSTYTPSTASNGTTYYYCIVTDGAGSTQSDIVSIVVSSPIDPTISTTPKTINPDDILDVSSMFESNSEGAFTYSITAAPVSAIEDEDYVFISPDFMATAFGDYTVQAVQAADGMYNSKTVTETITVRPKYTVTILTPEGGTLVVKNGETTLSSGDKVVYGTELTIEVEPDAMHNYTNWQYKKGDGSWITKTTNYTYTIDENNVSFRANFAAKVFHTITFVIHGINYPISVEDGTAIDFSNTPSAPNGYVFMGWKANSAINGTTNEVPTFTTDGTATEDAVYYAVFAKSATDVEERTKSYGFEDAAPSDWDLTNGPTRDNSNAKSGSYAGKISTNDTYVMFKNKVYVTNFAFSFKRTSNNNNYNVYIETSTDNSAWTAAETYAMSGFTNGSYMDKSKSFDGKKELYVRFHCNNTTAIRYVDDIIIKYNEEVTTYEDYCTTIPNVILSLTADTWASYCFPTDVTIPTSDPNLKVYRAKFNSSTNELTATPISEPIKAGEGVLLKTTTEGTTAYEFTTTTGAVSLGSTNDLIGTIVATPTASLKGSALYLMALKKNDNKFVRFEGESFPAYRACLAITPENTNAPSAFRIVEEEQNATSVQNIESNDDVVKFFENGQLFIKKNGVVYDAVGRRVR